jgi:prefoldin subunit 1
MANRDRFVSVPMDAVGKRISTDSTELKTDISNLEKKLHSLEMTHKNGVENLQKIMKSGDRS